MRKLFTIIEMSILAVVAVFAAICLKILFLLGTLLGLALSILGWIIGVAIIIFIAIAAPFTKDKST